MKTQIHILLILALVASCSRQESIGEISNRVFERAEAQLILLDTQIPEGLTPRSVKDGELISAPINYWCSGFYPGSLCLAYSRTGNPLLLELSLKHAHRLDTLLRCKTTHDVGFMLNCSFGNLYRLTADSSLCTLLHEGAAKLSSRYSPVTGTIRSWDFGDWKWPVIIDNMMNLELLMRYGTPEQREIAVTHAKTTLKNHFRPDFTSYHVVDYDPSDGSVRGRQTHQGYADESAWARGQAWALYGYTMMARECSGYGRDEDSAIFLKQAENIARMLLKRLPQDGIPVWDLDAPALAPEGAPEASYKDASAAAIMASAFRELSTMTKGSLARRCRKMAERQIRTLASPEYLAEKGENCGFLLKHSVGNLPAGSEIDSPLTYADYYFLEALTR